MVIVCIKIESVPSCISPIPSQDGIAMGASLSHRMAADGALLIYNVGPEAQGRWGTYDL